MKKILKYAAAVFAVFFAVALAVTIRAVPELPGYFLALAKSPFQKQIPPEQLLSRIEAYGFKPGAPLEDRIVVIPAALLELFRTDDKAPEYEAYAPSAGDKALVLEYIGLMPKIYADNFRERCAGIYFIKNLKGNGVTSWATDADAKIYFTVVLNPAALNEDLSATLTARESSCFKPQPGVAVSVDAGRKYKGLLYGLFHEGAHGLDYVKGISPVADDTMPESLRTPPGLTASFFGAYWEGFRKPAAVNDSPLRGEITFYGLNGGPKIPFSEAPRLYSWLAKSPFVSLYGSMSWAEDMAELSTFQLLTHTLGQPYKITVTGLPRPLVLEPLKLKEQFMRAALLMNDLDPSGRHIPAAGARLPGAAVLEAQQKKAEDLLMEAERLLKKN